MSKSKINILLTGCGAPGTSGTIHMLEKGARAENIELEIFGCDVLVKPPHLRGLSSVHSVPNPNEASYLKCLNSLIEELSIDLVIPQTTRESLILAGASKVIKAPVAVLPKKTFELLNDKIQLTQIFKEAGLPFPKYFEVLTITELKDRAHELGYPQKDVVIKLPDSSGMRGVRKLSAIPETATEFISEKPHGWTLDLDSFTTIFAEVPFPRLMVMEYLPGAEITVDVLVRNNICVVVQRSRNVIRAGISMDADLHFNDAVQETVTKLVKHLGIEGLFGFQMIFDGQEFKILECNPRVQGTMVASLLSGVNILWTEVKWHLGMNILESEFQIKHDAGNFTRSWGGTLNYQDGTVERF